MLNEASIMQDKYMPGHKFEYTGSGGGKELSGSYKDGDLFTIVALERNATEITGKGNKERYLQAHDGKGLKFVGGES